AHQSLPLRFAAHAVTVAVEVVRVWWLDGKVVERNICTVQIGRRRRDADSRIGRIAATPAPTATSRRGLLHGNASTIAARVPCRIPRLDTKRVGAGGMRRERDGLRLGEERL